MKRVVVNDAKASLPLHRHDNARIIVVLDGEVHENGLDGRSVYRRGDFLFRPPFYAHANTPAGAPSSFLRLPVSKTAWLSIVRERGWRTLRGNLNLEDRLHRSLLQDRRNADDLLAGLSPSISRYNTVGGLYAAFEQSELIGEIADANKLKPYAFTRMVRRQFGLTPTALRREWRLSRALSALAFGDACIAAIAVDCGFADQSHLARDVKGSTGLSPAAFRKFAQP
ncbi:MAG: helix-turn-helix domain-containing protein [Hyphococcus sp.]